MNKNKLRVGLTRVLNLEFLIHDDLILFCFIFLHFSVKNLLLYLLFKK